MDNANPGIRPMKAQREPTIRRFGYIGRPATPDATEPERKKWHGMPPTRVAREKLVWRGSGVF